MNAAAATSPAVSSAPSLAPSLVIASAPAKIAEIISTLPKTAPEGERTHFALIKDDVCEGVFPLSNEEFLADFKVMNAKRRAGGLNVKITKITASEAACYERCFDVIKEASMLADVELDTLAEERFISRAVRARCYQRAKAQKEGITDLFDLVKFSRT
jgi:hypothetical protein